MNRKDRLKAMQDVNDALENVHLARQALTDAKIFFGMANLPDEGGNKINSLYSGLILQRARNDAEKGSSATRAPEGVNKAVLRYIRDNEALVAEEVADALSEEIDLAETALADAYAAFNEE